MQSHTVDFATVTLTYSNQTTSPCSIPADLRLRAIEPSDHDLYSARPWNLPAWRIHRGTSEVVLPGRAVHIGFIWTAGRWGTRCIGPTQLQGVSVAFGSDADVVNVLFPTPQSICRLNATYLTSATPRPVAFVR